MNNSTKSKSIGKQAFNTRMLVHIGLMSAIAYVVMFFETPVFGFPDFLKIDLSDIPGIITALTFGPFAGVFVELIKNLLHFVTATKTGGIGEIANFTVGAAFVFTLGFVYNYLKRKAPYSQLKVYIISSAAATLAITAVGAVSNYFVFLPLFAEFYGADINYYIQLGHKILPIINDLFTFVIFIIAPFNFLKGVLISLLSYYIYKGMPRLNM